MKARICKEKHWNVHLRFFLVMMGDLLFSVSVLAQSNLITGKVIDNASEPIIGASIQSSVVGKGTISNMNGDFSIEVPVGTELTISFLGYRTQKIKVSDMRSLVIKLLEDTQALDEVVVVGYGVQKKESLTGAISNIKNDEIIKTKATSLAQSLEGKVSGLKIRQNDGEPGQFRSDINIRGLGTPLFIIDGIVRDGANEFQRLNPDDIESISFLKDGTAAIYGMNSANGAIIVTTKKGYKGKAKISLSANWGWSKPTNIPRMANAAQYMELRNDAAILGEGNPLVTKEELELWKTGASGYASTDLYDHVIKNSSIQQQYTLSLQGGSDIVSYFGSFSYASDEGLLKSGDLRYEKFTFRSNTDIKIAKGLTAGVNLAGRYDKTSQPWNSFYEIFKQTRVNVPTVPAYANNNPDYLATQSMGINPIALADADMTGYHYYYNKNFQSTFTLKYEVPFVQGLSIQGQLGYDYNHNKHKGLRKKFSTYTYAIETDEYMENEYNNPSMIQVNNNEASRLDMQAQISYNRLFNDTHNVSATLVYERRQEKSDWSNIERKFDLLTYDEVDYAGLKDAVSGGMSNEQAFISYVGRFNYDYKGRYLLELGFRNDGSYRYAPGSRWAFFPMGSIGWRLSEEKFLKEKLGFLDNLKIRASYGESGQDAGDPFQYVSGYNLNVGIYEFNDGTTTSGISAPSITNTNLTWYKAKLLDIGFDLSIFKGLFSLEFDLYQRKRSGLLATRVVSLPNTFGSQLPQENLNSDLTRGIDITLGHTNKIRNFSYSVKANMNLARTRMEHVERGPFTSSMDRWRNQSSGRWNDFTWGYQTNGQFQTTEEIKYAPVQDGELGNSKELPGDYRYVDANGDGIIDDNDRMPLFWSGTPLIHYGFNLEASWKNFDIYALLQGAGMYTVQFSEVYAEVLWSKGANTPAYFYDRWRKEDPYNPNSKWVAGKWPATRLIQDTGAMYKESNIWRRDASYLRLKTLELGYTLPDSILRKSGISNIRFYINGYNLLTFCDSFVKAFDPEKVEGSYSAGMNYPLTKSFNIGFTANF